MNVRKDISFRLKIHISFHISLVYNLLDQLMPSVPSIAGFGAKQLTNITDKTSYYTKSQIRYKSSDSRYLYGS